MSTINLDPTLYTTRPTDERLPKEARVYDLLESLRVPFIRVDHEATATIEACLEVEKLLDIAICKNLFLTNAQKSRFYLLMMPGEKHFATKILSKQIGSARLSFAGPEYMEKYLDITPGAVSVLGLMNDPDNMVELLIDRDVVQHEFIGCHPCVNTSSLKLKTSDVLDVILPAIHHEPRYVDLTEA